MAAKRDLTRQLEIVHISDVHFGDKHRFNPAVSAAGDRPEEVEFPSLLEKLKADLQGPDPRCPVVLAITGDLAEIGARKEFQEAEKLIRGLAEAEILGKKRGTDSVFLVPGNHDVHFDSGVVAVRWKEWTRFVNRCTGSKLVAEDPWSGVRVINRVAKDGFVFACLNSSIYVQKGKPDQDRGRVDIKQLTSLQDQLDAIPREELGSAIKVAVIHHHPVLIPSLAEPRRGYDAIHNSGLLLAILRRYGFHLVLHGHKHNPHTFTDDAKPAHQETEDHSMMIVAGGSAGSTELPTGPGMTNCYNRITVKWHPKAAQTRVRVETRGLEIFNTDHTERLPTRWKWKTMRVDDRHFYGFDHVPELTKRDKREFSQQRDGSLEDKRIAVYEKTRGNLPVVHVRPSLLPGQAYEAVLWIVPHPHDEEKPPSDVPEKVVWTAGRMFEILEVTLEQDPSFAASLAYWGPMLVQAQMTFPDGYKAMAHVYARMPSQFPREPGR